MLVMLGGRGAGTNRGFWSRVVMAESNGVWLMELIHGLTGFKDLYHFDNDVDPPRARHRQLRRDVGIQPDPPDRLHQERARLARRARRSRCTPARPPTTSCSTSASRSRRRPGGRPPSASATAFPT